MHRSASIMGIALGLVTGRAAFSQTLPPVFDPAFAVIAEQSRTAFTIQGTGGRAVGTGGAFIAVADDATAVSFNPAGLAQLLRPEFSLVGQNLTRNQDFRNFSTRQAVTPDTFDDSTSSDRRTSPLFFSTAVPFKRAGRNLVVQISYQRIIDLDFDSDRAFRFRPSSSSTAPARRVTQSVQQQGGIALWSVGVGAEISPRILLGASVNLWRGNWSFQSIGTRINESTGGEYITTLSQTNEFRGWNYNLGLIWRSQYLNAGLVYHSPFTADYTFQNNEIVDPETGPANPVTGQHFSTQINWPETLGAGLAFHPTDRFTLAADYTRTRWSRATFKPTGTSVDGANFFDLQVASTTADTKDVRGGIEWIAWLGDKVIIPIRIGAFREPQPTVDHFTGQQRVFKGYTFGIGIKFKDVNFDLAYKSSTSEREVTRFLNVDSNPTPASAAYGTESDREQRIYLSIGFQMDGEKVRKALGWFFVGN